MNKSNGNRIKKVGKIFIRILLTLLIIAIIILGYFWNRYSNKNSLISSFETPQNQTVYLLGTIHKTHFNKFLGYSMEDITSVIENIKPDCVLIEAREDIYDTYGVVDGPIDMAVVYSYCMDHNIQVGMIDWWVIDNQFKSNSTNDKRDDKIYENISLKLNNLPSNLKVLVVCGSGHFYEQSERFIENGWIKKSIPNKKQIFVSNTADFTYPKSLESVWENRAYFYAYTQPMIVKNDPTLNTSIKAEFTGGNPENFYKSQMKYCDLFQNNKLYE